MRPIGFSTGALAKSDVFAGIQIQRELGISAVEVSALRFAELHPLINALAEIKSQLNGIDFVSFHAPSEIPPDQEASTVDVLRKSIPEEWPIVVHPDAIRRDDLWLSLGSRLCIENMDQRKSRGRTRRELDAVFERLPNAQFCFDIGHCHQVDPTMVESIQLLTAFKQKLTLVHVSQVNSSSHHVPLSFTTFRAYRDVAQFIPIDCPLIVEAVVRGDNVDRELEKVRSCFRTSDSIAYA